MYEGIKRMSYYCVECGLMQPFYNDVKHKCPMCGGEMVPLKLPAVCARRLNDLARPVSSERYIELHNSWLETSKGRRSKAEEQAYYAGWRNNVDALYDSAHAAARSYFRNFRDEVENMPKQIDDFTDGVDELA